MKDHYDVGILGVWYGCNYGSIATYYALQQTIEKLGYSTLMVHYPRLKPDDGRMKGRHSIRFAEEHYDISPSYHVSEIGELNKYCDAFVLGSDQLWNYGVTKIFGHSYFLDFRLPAIRRKLIEAVDCAQSDVSFAIMRFFDEYAAEVQRHMSYEEQTVFPYVESLLSGEKNTAYSIDIFRRQHDQIDIKLRELKNIIIKYYPSGSSNELNGVLFDIFNCEHELASHNAVEDELFIPAVERLAAAGPRTVKPEPLSAREKEIIVCVVKGMTNKQIADALCISAHTVITHRRNIAAKLQIHSAAGLTIYAIVNKLVELSEIKDTITDPQP